MQKYFVFKLWSKEARNWIVLNYSNELIHQTRGISKQKNSQESLLYNKILDFSRNKLFYAKLGLDDTFQNRISLIFFHCSFLLIALRGLFFVGLFKASLGLPQINITRILNIRFFDFVHFLHQQFLSLLHYLCWLIIIV